MKKLVRSYYLSSLGHSYSGILAMAIFKLAIRVCTEQIKLANIECFSA